MKILCSLAFGTSSTKVSIYYSYYKISNIKLAFAKKIKKMMASARSNRVDDDSPLFNLNCSMVNKTDLDKLKVFARQNLGEDNTSDHFIKREKSIAFVYVENNQVFRLDQDHFIQHESKR